MIQHRIRLAVVAYIAVRRTLPTVECDTSYLDTCMYYIELEATVRHYR